MRNYSATPSGGRDRGSANEQKRSLWTKFSNQHRNFDTGSKSTAILTTADLLAGLTRRVLSVEIKCFDCRTSLRRAGYLFVSVEDDEVEYHLSAAQVANGRVVETAELKAIRKTFYTIRMSSFLKLQRTRLV